MYCRKCGNQLPEESTFCPFCGSKIEATEPEKPSPAAASSEKKRKRIWVILVAALVLAVIAVAILLYRDYGPGASAAATQTAGPSATPAPSDAGSRYDQNLEADSNNGGYLTFDSTHLYYVGYYNDSDNHTSVYSSDLLGNEKTIISTDGSIARIRAVGDKIYYVKIVGDSDFTIGCFNKDGTEDRTILDGTGAPWYLTVQDNILYYGMNNDLYYYSLDQYDGDEKKLLDDVHSICFAGNDIYFSDYDSLNVYHITEKSEETLCAATATCMLYDDGVLYYTNHNGLYSVSAHGGTPTALVTGVDINPDLCLYRGNILYIVRMPEEELNNLINEEVEDNEIDKSMVSDMQKWLQWVGDLYVIGKNGGDPVKHSEVTCSTFGVTSSSAYSFYTLVCPQAALIDLD